MSKENKLYANAINEKEKWNTKNQQICWPEKISLNNYKAACQGSKSWKNHMDKPLTQHISLYCLFL